MNNQETKFPIVKRKLKNLVKSESPHESLQEMRLVRPLEGPVEEQVESDHVHEQIEAEFQKDCNHFTHCDSPRVSSVRSSEFDSVEQKGQYEVPKLDQFLEADRYRCAE